MSIEHILEILDKCHHGPVCTVKEWETRVIPTKVSQKLKEHGLQGTFTPENPINTDDALADEFFKAGFDLAVDIGMLCPDTERVVNLTEEEIKDGVRNAPSELILGEGRERVVMKHRKPEDKYLPLLSASMGIVVSEDIWVTLMQGIVQHREIDIFNGGSISTIFGHPVLAGTPYETLVGRYEAQLKREVLWRAGRQGMHTVGVISSTTQYGQLGGYGIADGFDPANSTALVMFPGEMQVPYATLHKVVHAINCGGLIASSFESFIGGYPGPTEGATLVQIAGMLLHLTMFQSHYVGSGIYDISNVSTSGRNGQWATSVHAQARSRNTHLLHKGLSSQVAGPCTEMLLYESAVGMMNLSASGAEMVVEPRSAGGRYTDYLTPLECKFCGEVLKRSAGMTRKKVNEIAKVLIPKYEGMLLNPPKGKSVRECYDLKTLKPTQEWLDIYLKVKKELIELGVPLEYP